MIKQLVGNSIVNSVDSAKITNYYIKCVEAKEIAALVSRVCSREIRGQFQVGGYNLGVSR